MTETPQPPPSDLDPFLAIKVTCGLAGGFAIFAGVAVGGYRDSGEVGLALVVFGFLFVLVSIGVWIYQVVSEQKKKTP